MKQLNSNFSIAVTTLKVKQLIYRNSLSASKRRRPFRSWWNARRIHCLLPASSALPFTDRITCDCGKTTSKMFSIYERVNLLSIYITYVCTSMWNKTILHNVSFFKRVERRIEWQKSNAVNERATSQPPLREPSTFSTPHQQTHNLDAVISPNKYIQKVTARRIKHTHALTSKNPSHKTRWRKYTTHTHAQESERYYRRVAVNISTQKEAYIHWKQPSHTGGIISRAYKERRLPAENQLIVIPIWFFSTLINIKNNFPYMFLCMLRYFVCVRVCSWKIVLYTLAHFNHHMFHIRRRLLRHRK